MSQIIFRNANMHDWAQLAQLLQNANLPIEGAQAHLQNFVVAVRDDKLIGCAGLEVYQRYGLLRSVAVTAEMRGQGLGVKLAQEILNSAQAKQLTQLILLTETAQNFFPRFGFMPISRTEVPEAIKESVEFKGACPESAVAMRLTFAG